MKLCESLDELLREPTGRWMLARDGVFWCHSPQLCGIAIWGRGDREDALAFLRIMAHYDLMERGFDMVLDAGAVDGINPDALATVLDWLRVNDRVVREYMGRRVAIVPANVTGLALAGIGPALSLNPARIVTDARAAFRIVRPRDGDALHDEIQALIGQARNLPPVVVALRGVLNEANGAVKLNEVARALGTSTRSLQRQLAAAGVSFRDEQSAARFRAAVAMLGGDDKLATIAARIGITEDGLTKLVRAEAGLTPSELRVQLRKPGELVDE